MSKIKRLCKILSAITASALVIGTAGFNTDMMTNNSVSAAEAGDLNTDGSVNAADVVLLKKFLTNQAELPSGVSADLNADSKANVFDFTILKKTAIANAGVVNPEPTESSIVLADSGITFTGTGATLSEDLKTITITQPGTFIVTGEMTGGQIIVDVDKTTYAAGAVELSLEGMSLTNTTTSPIYIASIDDECVISAKKKTENTITDGTSYTNADSDVGAIYSKDDLKFKGKGTLNVIGNCADAIVSKDDIKIYNSTLNVTAVDDGIRGKDSVKIGDADDTAFDDLKVTVKTTNGDGIKTTVEDDETKGNVTINGGTINIDAYADGIQAIRNVEINGGTLEIETYEGSAYTGSGSSSGSGSTGGPGGGMGQDGNSNKTDISAKAIKAGDADLSIVGSINVNGGTITADSSDDCIHANGDVNLTGGRLNLASADDAVHSDATVNIGTEGLASLDDVVIYASKCYEGIEGLNINNNSGTVIVNSTDDGYNAAGGADGSGSTGGWDPWNPGGGSSSGNYSLNIKGGFVLVNATDGDHDGFDSNGSLTISGGYAVSNGNEPFDADGTMSYTGGVYIIDKGAGGMGGGMGGSSLPSTLTASASINAGERITLTDGSGNVVVSFIADKSVSTLTAGANDYSSAKFYSGGEVTNGTNISEDCGSQSCYVGGTLSGGTELSSGSGNQNPWGY